MLIMQIPIFLFALAIFVSVLYFIILVLRGEREPETPYTKVFSKEFLAIANQWATHMYYNGWLHMENTGDKIVTSFDEMKKSLTNHFVNELHLKGVNEIPENAHKAIEHYIKLKMKNVKI